jgi:integrase
MMIDWHEKSMRALQLAGMGESTQKAYTRSVRKLVEHFDKTPDQITEEELQDYFLHRRNVSRWSSATMKIAHAGVRFFFVNVLERNWNTFNYMSAQKESRLPTVLTLEEVARVLACVYTFHNRVFFSIVYACGLRLQEALHLEVSDIDSGRMMIHVHLGKGAKERLVPLPKKLLQLLRSYWGTHRHRRFLFPALGRSGQGAATAKQPMATSSVCRGLSKTRCMRRTSIKRMFRFIRCVIPMPPICWRRV